MPCEYSTGTSRVQGSIIKAGNTHVRRLLIEPAWHHRKSYSTSGPTLRARWAVVEPALRARGHAGNRASTTVAAFHRTRQEPTRSQRRHRSGTGRLVLVTGNDVTAALKDLADAGDQELTR